MDRNGYIFFPHLLLKQEGVRILHLLNLLLTLHKLKMRKKDFCTLLYFKVSYIAVCIMKSVSDSMIVEIEYIMFWKCKFRCHLVLKCTAVLCYMRFLFHLVADYLTTISEKHHMMTLSFQETRKYFKKELKGILKRFWAW